MSIPYSDKLSWENYGSNPDWYKNLPERAPALIEQENQLLRAAYEVIGQAFQEPVVRSIQFIRDAARLVLKVPVRSIWTPIWLPKNWKQLERSKINAQLTGYSFVQLVSVPPKFLVALTALATSAISFKKAQWLLDNSGEWTAYLDGRASQLEALKEVGGKKAADRKEYDLYKNWLYSIDAKLCRKEN